MKRMVAVVGGLAIGVTIMLGILQPWNGRPRSGTPAPPPPAPAAAPDRLDEALKLIEEGRIDAAREALKPEFQAAWPAPRAFAVAALADLKSGNVKAAQEGLAKAASLDPDLFEVALFQGHLDMLLDDHSAARRSYTAALERRPGDAKSLAGRAAARFELKEYAGAVEDASAAIAVEPDALFTRAAAYGSLERNEEAVRDWTAYLARRPKDAHAWRNRGNAHERMGNKAAAATDWREAVKLDASLGDQLNPLITEADR